MGKRGPVPMRRKKAAERAANSDQPVEIGRPPTHLRAEAAQVWREVVEQLPEGILANADVLLLEVLADAVVDYREAQRTVQAEGATIKTASGMHRHPAAVAAQQHRSAMRSCFADLGMSPQARARIGLTLDREEADPLDDLIGG